MNEPWSFPVLAGAALTGAIGFLYSRIGAVLDRRAGRLSAEEPEVVDGWDRPLEMRLEALDTAGYERLAERADALRALLEHPERCRGDDPSLMQLLSGVRDDLEAVYAVTFRFGDEPSTDGSQGPVVRVRQEAEEADTKVLGVGARGITGNAEVDITQKIDRLRPGSEMTGLQIDGTIG